MAAPLLNFHRVAFKRQREGGRRGWGLVWGPGGGCCVLFCSVIGLLLLITLRPFE